MKVALIKCPWWVRYCPPYIIAYFQKEDTFIALSGYIELDDILSIIDSLVIDK